MSESTNTNDTTENTTISTPEENAVVNNTTSQTNEKTTEKETKAPESTSDSNTPQAPKPQKPVSHPRPMAPKHASTSLAIDADALNRASSWGRVDDDGNVWQRTAEGEKIIGQYAAGGSKKEALELYARRFLDLESQIKLLESRISHVSPEDSLKSLKRLTEQLKEPAFIGDIDSLRSYAHSLEEKINTHKEELKKAREEAKQKAIEKRTKIVERAEEIASTDVQKIHWRNFREELSQLFESWQKAQKEDPRLDRPTEEELWHRFSRARSQFDRMRRQHFSQLEAKRAEVIATKNSLIKKAEELQDSTNWSHTASEFRSLMDQWRKAGRASHKEDDKLWNRFHTAQQKFFDARKEFFDSRDKEFEANLEKKLQLIEEAEKILPITDLEQAKTTLYSIQDRWEEIGMVPRADMNRTEKRLRDIENAVHAAETEQWNRTDPQKKQRNDGMVAQLEKLLKELDQEIAAAKERGDDDKVASLEEDKAARSAWLEQLTKEEL